MVEIVKEFRGIPLWVVEANVKSLGEGAYEGSQCHGHGWTIEISELPPVKLGALNLGRVWFRLHGDETEVARIWKALAPGFLRGGG